MSVGNCRRCGWDLVFPAGQELLICPACGTGNGAPRAKGEALKALMRAHQQRVNRDFYNAEISYQNALRDCPEEHAALWGRLLCHYGVEHVLDERTGEYLPVVRFPRRKPMQAQGDFADACRYAPAEVRALYEAEAEYIDRSMRRVIDLAETCPPYDVFLCHKTSVRRGAGYTDDFARAAELYRVLTAEGFRVFFAPESLRDQLGENYGAGIYHALDTARVMLVICSSQENLNGVWVRNEWDRYLEMLDEREDKRLVPLLYGEFRPEDLPREFAIRDLEALKMGEVGAMERVMGLLGKQITAPAKPAPKPRRKVEHKPAPAIGERPAQAAPEADFQTANVPGGVSITKYVGNQARVCVPDTIGGKPVVAVDGAFAGCHGLAAVWLPQSLTRIGDKAFRDCARLTAIEIPAGVTVIGKEAYSDCSGLTAVDVPEAVRKIDERAFSGCTDLVDVNLPDSIERIEMAAFRYCTSLPGLTLPSKMRMVTKELLLGCTALEWVELPVGVKSIEAQAFWGCPSMTEVIVDDENATYYVCDGVLFTWAGELVHYPAGKKATSYTVPDGVKKICAHAFSCCTSLQKVLLPLDIQLANCAFDSCDALRKIDGKNYSFGAYYGIDTLDAAVNNCARMTKSLRLAVVRDSLVEETRKILRVVIEWLFSDCWFYLCASGVLAVLAIVGMFCGWFVWWKALLTLIPTAVAGLCNIGVGCLVYENSLSPVRGNIAGACALLGQMLLSAAILGWVGWLLAVLVTIALAITGVLVVLSEGW